MATELKAQDWAVGWGTGLTGPNTPTNNGVTCGDAVKYQRYHRALDEHFAIPILKRVKLEIPETPKSTCTPISIGRDTVAIATNFDENNGQTTAEFIVKTCRYHQELVETLARLTRIAKVELGATRPDVIEQAEILLGKVR